MSANSHEFQIIREEIDDADTHFLVIGFPTRDGKTGVHRMERGNLLDQRRAQRELATKGALLPADCKSLLAELFAAPAPIKRIVNAAGWHDQTFISRYGTLTESSGVADVEMNPDLDGALQRLQSGSRKEFRSGVRPLLGASPYLTFAYLLALTPPMASRAGIKGGFSVCYCQQSSTGKSSCLRLAQSLVTRADSDLELEPFGNTLGKTLDTLPIYGGQAISFGDLKLEQNGRATVEKLRTVVFSNAEGKTRHRKGEPKPPQTQFAVFLFSAENPLVELFRQAGVPFEDGEAVRLLDIPVPDRNEGGIFASADEPSSTLIDKLDELLNEQYGQILPAWVRKLATADSEKLNRKIEKIQKLFVGRLGTLPPHHRRIAKTFGLVYAVGWAAVGCKMIPLTRKAVRVALELIFQRVINRLDTNNSDAAESWQRFLSLLDDLPSLKRGTPPASSQGIGFKRTDGPHKGTIYLRKDLLGDAVGGDALETVIIPGLVRCGCIPAQGPKTVPVKQKGLGRCRYYRLSEQALIALRAQLQSD